MPTITNKVTITQGQISVVLMLLEKWWNRPVPGLAAGHWYLDDGLCGAKIRLGSGFNTREDNFWYYDPVQSGGILGIGARPQTLDYDTNTIGPALNTYVALFGVTRVASGRFSVAGGSGPGSGILYAFGNAGLTPGKPVAWESEWGSANIFAPANENGISHLEYKFSSLRQPLGPDGRDHLFG